MPISKSAKKSLRVALRKTAVNRHRKALVKEALKNVSADNAAKAVSMIDKAAKWGLFHPNKAARLKGQVAKNIGKPITAKGPKAEKPIKKTAAKKPATKKSATKKVKK